MPSSIDQLIGANLRNKRIELNLSQHDLGAMLEPKITFQQIQKYERGKNRISAGALLCFAKGMGCTVMDFYDKAGDLLKGEAVTIPLAPKKLPEDDITLYYSHVPNALKPHIKALCKAVADNWRMPE